MRFSRHPVRPWPRDQATNSNGLVEQVKVRNYEKMMRNISPRPRRQIICVKYFLTGQKCCTYSDEINNEFTTGVIQHGETSARPRVGTGSGSVDRFVPPVVRQDPSEHPDAARAGGAKRHQSLPGARASAADREPSPGPLTD